MPLQVVVALRHLGHNVLTTRDVGQDNQRLPDESVLAFAKKDRRAVLTPNRKHFIRLHAENEDHHGIVVCTFDPDLAAQAQRIDVAVRELDSIDRQLLRVNRPG